MNVSNINNLKPYNLKELKISRVSSNHRSQGDGEETESRSSYINKELELITRTCNKKVDYSKNLKPDKCIAHNLLPPVSNVAQKLKKVSLFTVPNSVLLNTPPSGFDKEIKILLKPQQFVPKRLYASSAKKKEPKFVPYEPYKGCIKPICGAKKAKNNIKNSLVIKTLPSLHSEEPLKSSKKVSVNENEKFNIIIVDFEKEKTKWEMENNSLRSENQKLQKQLTEVQKEYNVMQNHLSVQSQVNSELKKLLVASVGEDVQGRVQCLTEDKARMATMIRKYSEKVDKDYEEKEKMSIQCDVWRSKFLASSLLIDELARWKGVLFQHIEDSREAIRVLLQEREVIHHSLIKCYKHIYQIQESFDPFHAESEGVGILDSSDVLSLSVAVGAIGENLRDRLLGKLGRAVGNLNLHFPDETRTPGEKIAAQVLECSLDPSKVVLNFPFHASKSTVVNRFHPHSRADNLTVNCCGHCSGEIKVV